MDPLRPAVQPGWSIWACWGLALTGGVAVLVAAVVTLTEACQPDVAEVFEACAPVVPVTLVGVLTAGGTALAVTGALTAVLITIRRFGRGEPGPASRR